MRAAYRGDRASRSEEVANRICKLRCLGECAYEDKVRIRWQFLDEAFTPRVTHECDIVPFPFAPHAHCLRHYACHVGIHNPREQGSRRTLSDEINDPYSELSLHTNQLCRGREFR